ncbi:MAG TPA: hypothetical protein EYP53_02935 [Candidatus Latescibacteria bacterium]|nr:hypothetical protein [Candidatus Latescibacterota bacterium]
MKDGFALKAVFGLIMLLAMVSALSGQEKKDLYLCRAILLQKPAPITIDGDLSDWEGLDVEVHPIENVCTSSGGGTTKFARPTGDADLSANFMCLADLHNFYVAVSVNDDKIIFGEEPFGVAHEDDSIEVYFDGDLIPHPYQKGVIDYDANDAEIRFSKKKDGTVVLEGMGLFGGSLFMFPGLWESLGIVAAIKENPRGYTAELKVPKGVFVSVPLKVGVKVGLNVMINDDDDGGARDSKISWTADLGDESWQTTRYFGQLLIDRTE